jgi:hypothetical protein
VTATVAVALLLQQHVLLLQKTPQLLAHEMLNGQIQLEH